MFLPVGEDEHGTPGTRGRNDVAGNHSVARSVRDHPRPKHVQGDGVGGSPGIESRLMQEDLPRKVRAQVGEDVPDRAALEMQEPVQAILAPGSRREAKYEAAPAGLHELFERYRRHMVAFVDDDHAVGAEDFLRVLPVREGLHHRHVDASLQLPAASSQRADLLPRQSQEFPDAFDPLVEERLSVDQHQ